MLIGTALGGCGQLFFKLGLSNKVQLTEFLSIGIILYFVATVFYLYVLGRSNLSWAYGLGGLSYIFATTLASFILGEPVSLLRWVGVLIIAIGTALVGLS